MDNIGLSKYVEEILKKYKLCNMEKCSELNIGFNRAVFNLDDKFVLKICINPNKEQGVKNEISFFKNNFDIYCPKLIIADDSKQLIPYIYTIEEKINGCNLFDVWGKLNYQEKRNILFNLVEILKKIHNSVCASKYNVQEITTTFNIYLERCIRKNIFSSSEICYFEELQKNMKYYLENAKIGFIHGDIHFNNIILSQEGIKLIDFECYTIGPIDKEFDSINRMIRNPNSFVMNGNSNQYHNHYDYLMIMNLLKELYPEICSEQDFENRLLIYDCLNSMKWIATFPEHKQYHEVLFRDSKKLIKSKKYDKM